MLLFKKRFHAGLRDGSITLTFRNWQKPRVKVGGRYRCHPLGVLEVDRIDQVRLRDITPEELARAGFKDRDDLVEYLREWGGDRVRDEMELYRVELHHGGDGDRVQVAMEADLSPKDVADLTRRLDRMDALSPIGPWTRQTLRLIARHPRVAASKLAKRVKRGRDDFKVDVRKLKRLGLTQSFEVGYELSPRGKAFLAARKPRSKTKR